MASISVSTMQGETAQLEADAVEGLRARLQGELLLPGGAGFEEASRIWNGMIRRMPALVVRPTAVDDVVESIRFARDHHVLLSVKGGGHNIAGTALADGGLTLDMSRMKSVEVDPKERVVRVGPGCLLQDVDRATQAYGLATVLGFVSETGVAGLTLGGGFGYLTRRFGWAVDNLLEVEIVTADGKVRRVSREAQPDLFWAVRGGGGNFGVITEFVYRLHPIGPEITGGLLAWPAETPDRAQRALEAYRDLTASAPRELTVFLGLMRAPRAPFVPSEAQGRRVAVFIVCHTGEKEDAKSDLASLYEALGPPAMDLVTRRPYVDQQSLTDGMEPDGFHYYWKSEMVSELTDGLLATFRDLGIEDPIPMGQVLIAHLGGALNERPPDDGAVGNRDARFVVGVAGNWEPDDPNAAAHKAWVRRAWERFRPFSTGGNYINFQTADDGQDRIRATYGANYLRLAEIKARYDPENLFRSNRNIAPRAEQ